MKKIFTIILAVLVSAPLMMAQISEGQPSAKKIRTGNRPEAGNFGLYFGLTSDIFDALGGGSHVTPLPIVNLKYMATDKLEIRAGLEPFSSTDKASAVDAGNTNYKSKESEGHFYLYPGVAYHFSTKNILDVYCGAELPLGYYRFNEKTTTGNMWESASQGGFRLGLGAFVGLQAFIANLPLALGLEYGISANAYLGGQVKATTFDGTTKQVKYSDAASGYSDMTKLHLNGGTLGNQFRLTLSYYFK